VRIDDNLVCDVPGCNAKVPDDSPMVILWDVITGNDAPVADLCPSCASKRAGGTLADAA
jgi:hypothetical protein